jgi:hypothetical protein
MGVALIIGAIIFLVIIVNASKNSSVSSSHKVKIPAYAINYLNDKGKKWVSHLINLYDSGSTFESDAIDDYEKMFNVNFSVKNLNSLYEDIGIGSFSSMADETNQYKAFQMISDLDLYLSIRYYNQYFAITPISPEEAMNKYQINLQSNEVLLHHSYSVDWYEERTVGRSVSYGGYSYHKGGYNIGSYRTSSTAINQFVAIDRGDFYITNKRIILVGKQNHQTKTVPINNIINLELYQDGVLIGKPNGKKPLIVVPEYLNQAIPRNSFHEIIRVLDRVMQGNWDVDLIQRKGLKQSAQVAELPSA